MKKLVTIILSLALAVCALLSLTACSLDVNGKTFVYDSYQVRQDLTPSEQELLDGLVEEAKLYKVTFNADGTGVWEIEGYTTIDFTWEQNDAEGKVKFGEDDERVFKAENGKVAVTDEVDSVTFTIYLKQA